MPNLDVVVCPGCGRITNRKVRRCGCEWEWVGELSPTVRELLENKTKNMPAYEQLCDLPAYVQSLAKVFGVSVEGGDSDESR